jgi:CheY-like chemotaxis protein
MDDSGINKRPGAAPARRILLIEDQQEIREVAALSLQSIAGWEVQSVASGRAGITLAASMQPDAILLDVMMPDMDGAATLAVLREQLETRKLPVIFITAKASGLEDGWAERCGAQGVIGKPFDPMRLPGQVRALLGWED